MRTFAAIAATLLLAALAGCGGSEETTAASAADAVPAAAAAYLSVQSDLDSAQWDQVDELLGRFPDGDRALPGLRAALAGKGLDWERDVEPALGSTVEFVWLDFEDNGEDVVALTQPDDDDKLRALADKVGDPAVVGEVGDWSAVARSRALIDRYRDALDDGKLADENRFSELTADLPDDALATFYVDGERATKAAEGALRESGRPLPLGSANRLIAGAAALQATDTGFLLRGVGRTDGAPPELNIG